MLKLWNPSSPYRLRIVATPRPSSLTRSALSCWRTDSRDQSAYFVETHWSKARQPFDAASAPDVTLACPLFALQVGTKTVAWDRAEHLLECGRHRIDAGLEVGMKQRTARGQHVIGVDRCPHRASISIHDCPDVLNVGGKGVGDQRMRHRAERQVMQVGGVHRHGAVLRIGQEIRKEQ